jgi:hypothetical protein
MDTPVVPIVAGLGALVVAGLVAVVIIDRLRGGPTLLPAT